MQTGGDIMVRKTSWLVVLVLVVLTGTLVFSSSSIQAAPPAQGGGVITCNSTVYGTINDSNYGENSWDTPE